MGETVLRVQKVYYHWQALHSGKKKGPVLVAAAYRTLEAGRYLPICRRDRGCPGTWSVRTRLLRMEAYEKG